MIADYKNLTKMSSFCSLVEPLKVAHFEVSGEVDLRSNLRDSVYRKKNREPNADLGGLQADFVIKSMGF